MKQIIRDRVMAKGALALLYLFLSNEKSTT